MIVLYSEQHPYPCAPDVFLRQRHWHTQVKVGQPEGSNYAVTHHLHIDLNEKKISILFCHYIKKLLDFKAFHSHMKILQAIELTVLRSVLK